MLNYLPPLSDLLDLSPPKIGYHLCMYDPIGKMGLEAQGCAVWQYGLLSFQTGYTKLERFLHKNQHTQRKLLNFENWTNGEPQ